MIESIEFLSTSTFTHAFFPPLALPPSLPPLPALHFLGYTRQTSGETGSAISQINTCVIIIVIIIILMVPIVPDFRCTHKVRNKLGAMEAFLNTFPQDAPILLPSKASMHCENCTYCYYWLIFFFYHYICTSASLQLPRLPLFPVYRGLCAGHSLETCIGMVVKLKIKPFLFFSLNEEEEEKKNGAYCCVFFFFVLFLAPIVYLPL